MPGEEAAIVKVMRDQVAAFSQGDIKATTEYWANPSVVLSPQGPTLRPKEQFAVTLEELLKSLKEDGFGRVEHVEAHVKQLSDAFAMVSTLTIRYKKDGSEIVRLGTLYMLTKTPQGWRMFMSASHGPEAVMLLENVPTVSRRQ